MSAPTKCEKCGAKGTYAIRMPCVMGCGGEMFYDHDTDRRAPSTSRGSEPHEHKCVNHARRHDTTPCQCACGAVLTWAALQTEQTMYAAWRKRAEESERALEAAAPHLHRRIGTIEVGHPEGTCEKCGGGNVIWFAPSPIWNAVVRRRNNDRDLMLCPVCFIVAAVEAGFSRAWRVAPADYHGPDDDPNLNVTLGAPQGEKTEPFTPLRETASVASQDSEGEREARRFNTAMLAAADAWSEAIEQVSKAAAVRAISDLWEEWIKSPARIAMGREPADEVALAFGYHVAARIEEAVRTFAESEHIGALSVSREERNRGGESLAAAGPKLGASPEPPAPPLGSGGETLRERDRLAALLRELCGFHGPPAAFVIRPENVDAIADHLLSKGVRVAQ